MAAKRAAGRQLTHDNWDDDEEPEEAGIFKQVMMIHELVLPTLFCLIWIIIISTAIIG